MEDSGSQGISGNQVQRIDSGHIGCSVGHPGEEGLPGIGPYRNFIYDRCITVSVPHRLDIGGTWDLPPLLYFGRQYRPKTVTIALDVMTTVSITDKGLDQKGKNVIVVSQDSEVQEWSGAREEYDYTSRLGLIFAVLSFFDMKNIEVTIDIGVPPKIGLGGSGVLCIALVTACTKYLGFHGGFHTERAIREAHEIENGFFSMTGFQDQMAALAGGVRIWYWQYPPEKSDSEELLPPIQYHHLENRIATAIVGRHESTEINQRQVDSFLKPETRGGWIDMSKGTAKAGEAIRDHDWESLVKCVRAEHAFRNRIAPLRIAGMEKFIAITEGRRGAFATAGAGQAVCWYISPCIEDVVDVTEQWAALGGKIIPSKIRNAPLVTVRRQTPVAPLLHK